ncbi:MAG: phosphoribosyltransferase [Saprospiraceae bacterium]|nr:MAG: phosphoribosyltransferase [Bacteroidetes bacterium OLB9]MCO6463682.1 phosphoribosyltransferase [Saprospiraceae bacterium]MCZ2337041.1 phosphoribosyltransferase [Chitinophagales bacterium]
MEVLNHYQIYHKIKRIAYEILENNLSEDTLFLIGINNNGYRFASLLHHELAHISNKNIILCRIRLNPAHPLEYPITVDCPSEKLQDKSIIIVDDVANTGRTIFYAFTPLLSFLPRKVEVAVLVDRKHKTFPVSVDYVGLSLATTVQENIRANLINEDQLTVSVE